MENIDIDIDIDKEILENIDIDIDIDKEISENIDIDKISNRLEFGISNRATPVGAFFWIAKPGSWRWCPLYSSLFHCRLYSAGWTSNQPWSERRSVLALLADMCTFLYYLPLREELI